MNYQLGRRAAVILSGGGSRRMGSPKAWLPFGPETMLQRIVGRLVEAVDDVIVVAAQGQQLPPLHETIRVIRDRNEDQGPVEGLATALAALDPSTEAVFVCGCDMPLITPEVVACLFDALADFDAAVPCLDGMLQPLGAVYRPRILAEIETMIASRQMRLMALVERLRVRQVDASELRSIDPQMLAFRSCNTPDEYRALLIALQKH